MKFIFITNDDEDYAAMEFGTEFNLDQYPKLWDELKANDFIQGKERIYEGKALEFGEVDLKFIQFICDEFIDYDISKQTDFFIV